MIYDYVPCSLPKGLKTTPTAAQHHILVNIGENPHPPRRALPPMGKVVLTLNFTVLLVKLFFVNQELFLEVLVSSIFPPEFVRFAVVIFTVNPEMLIIN